MNKYCSLKSERGIFGGLPGCRPQKKKKKKREREKLNHLLTFPIIRGYDNSCCSPLCRLSIPIFHLNQRVWWESKRGHGLQLHFCSPARSKWRMEAAQFTPAHWHTLHYSLSLSVSPPLSLSLSLSQDALIYKMDYNNRHAYWPEWASDWANKVIWT